MEVFGDLDKGSLAKWGAGRRAETQLCLKREQEEVEIVSLPIVSESESVSRLVLPNS